MGGGCLCYLWSEELSSNTWYVFRVTASGPAGEPNSTIFITLSDNKSEQYVLRNYLEIASEPQPSWRSRRKNCCVLHPEPLNVTISPHTCAVTF